MFAISAKRWVRAITVATGLVAVLFLAGCSTKRLTFDELSKSLKTLPEGKARIYVYRPSKRFKIRPVIKIDGTEIGRAAPLSFLYIDVAAGSHTLAVKTGVEDEVCSFNAGSGEVLYVRLTYTIKGWFNVAEFKPILVRKESALDEIKECCTYMANNQ